MVWPGTDDLIPTHPSLRPGHQFFAGFAEGFGFAGLFATLKQEPLPFPDETQTDPDESDKDLVNIITLLAKYDRGSVPARAPFAKGNVVRATE